LFVAWAVGGCAAVDERAADFAELIAPVELTSTPFHSQERFQCGPAALTTLLQASDVDVSLESVSDRVYLPGRQGSLQAELLATTRASERIPYRIDPSLKALIAELEAGRPVLVLQNLGVSWKPVWHYAVVIGVDPATERVILRSGTEYRRTTPVKVFLRTWARSDYWGLVALAPGELPANPDRTRFLKAVADFDTKGKTRLAYASWERAVATWPEDPGALFGMANAAFSLHEYGAAETHYRRLLEISPETHAARNNLAYAMARQGRAIEAIEEIEFILQAVASDDPFRTDYEDSWSEIAALLPPKESTL
jgi:tetratricopeptide (TPR) repeat protein